MRRNLVALVLFFSAQSLWAGPNPVLDPKNVLSQVDLFLGEQNFETTLVCESKARYFAPVQQADLGCDDSGCWSGYQTIESAEGNFEVHNCSADAVSIYSDTGYIWDISKADFEAVHGNMIRLFLPTVSDIFGYEGTVTLDSVVAAQYTLPSGIKLPAVNIQGEFRFPGAKYSFPLLVTVVKSAPGVAQMARLRLGNQSWLRLKEF